MNCRELDEIADSYLSDELSVETNHDLLSHLEGCSGCRAALNQRRELRMKLRSAVRANSRIDPAFAAGIQSKLKESLSDRPTRWLMRPITMFAGAVTACFVGLMFYGIYVYIADQTLPNSDGAQLQLHGATLALKDAVGNHKDCGLKFGSRAAIDFRKEDINLKTDMPDLEFVEEHDCFFKGKKYSHRIFRNGSNLISILKISTDSGRGGADSIASEPIDNYQIAEFTSGGNSVFVISDLSESDNLRFAQSVLDKAHI